VSFGSEDEKLDLIRKINNQIIKFGFEETALKLSESSSAVDKGDLGWVNVNGLTKKISAIILKMKINEVSEPILIGNSLLFIKLKDKKISNILESKKDKLKEQIINSKKNELFNLYSTSHLSKIRNNSIIQYQ
jgi:parvulin-like peptidyl-prolyl isomerase